MTRWLKGFDDWPRSKNQCPIFKTTQDALLYAQLIFDKKEERKLLRIFMEDCQIKLKEYREIEKPNMDHLQHLSLKAQLLRECFEEMQRIEDEYLENVKHKKGV